MRTPLTPAEKKARRDDRREASLALALAVIEQATGLTATREFRFHPVRKFRFDLAWPGLVAAEIDGGVWSGGRHTTGSGFIKDQEKTNLAALAGWRVFRFTWKDVDSGAFADTMIKAMGGE